MVLLFAILVQREGGAALRTGGTSDPRLWNAFPTQSCIDQVWLPWTLRGKWQREAVETALRPAPTVPHRGSQEENGLAGSTGSICFHLLSTPMGFNWVCDVGSEAVPRQPWEGESNLGLMLSVEGALSDSGFYWERGAEGRAAGAQMLWLGAKSSSSGGSKKIIWVKIFHQVEYRWTLWFALH